MNTRTTKVTISVAALKTAFRKTFPEQSAVALTPAWEKFWAGVVLGGKIELSLPLSVPEQAPKMVDDDPLDSPTYGDLQSPAAEKLRVKP